MKTTDYKNSFAIGLASSILWFFVLQHLALLSEGDLIAVVITLPFLAVLAVRLAHTIFRSAVFRKLVKFLVVGMLNTGVDFFIFNTLIVATTADKGLALTAFKAISFTVALVNSYFLNRAWTFDDEAAVHSKKSEFMRFALVTLVGFALNVGATTLIADSTPPLHLTQIRWDNVAAVIATALNLAWNFVGYRLFVFKTKPGHHGAASIAETEVITPYLPES